MVRLVRAVIACSVLALGVAACGGSPAPTASSPTAAPSQATSSPTPAPILALAASLDGKYTGSWKNATFGTTGPLAIEWKFDKTASTLTATVTVGGNVLGAPAPPAQVWVFKPEGQKLTYSGKSSAFGDVTATIDGGPANGTFVFKGVNLPGSTASMVDSNGTLSATEMTGTYTVGLTTGAKATGTVSAKR